MLHGVLYPPSKPSRSWGSNGDSFLHVSSVSQECTCMPDCTDRYLFSLFSQQKCQAIDACQTGYCILQVYSDNTYSSTKALVLYSTAEAENYRHSPPTLFLMWDFTEPGAKTVKRRKMQ